MIRRQCRGHRAGLTLVDVIVLLVVIGVVILLALMAASRGREHARLVRCRYNLAQIGMALGLYDDMTGHLPEIGQLEPPGGPSGPPAPSPLKTILETLQVADLNEIQDRKTRPNPRPAQVPGEIRVPGFICTSDPNALSGTFLAPINYRAVTGDGLLGNDGPFAPGPARSLAEVEARDGLSYTSAFCERLVGDNQSSHPASINYLLVPARLPSGGCPVPADPSAWRGDAGATWAPAGYRTTLYNHFLPPNGQPSCISANGRSASIGASSGHIGGVNLLLLDGSVSLIRPSINLKVWRDYATIGSASRGEAE